MKKIIGYIAGGQGLGVKYLALLSLVLGIIVGAAVKFYGQDGVPYAQQIADQMLPIKVVDGKIVEPQETYKVVHLRFGEDSAPYPIPLVLDTTSDTLDVNTLDPGAYISRKNIYLVKDREVRTYNLEGSFDLPQDDYTGFFNSMLNWVSIIAAVGAFAGLFIMYFMLTLIYSVCAIPLAGLASKKVDFDGRMRLSALAVIAAYVISWTLRFATGISLSTFVFFVLVVALQGIMIYKLPAAPEAPAPQPALPEEEAEPVVVDADKPKKKAPAKKKPAVKASKPKTPAKGKPAAAKKDKPAAKAKQ